MRKFHEITDQDFSRIPDGRPCAASAVYGHSLWIPGISDKKFRKYANR